MRGYYDRLTLLNAFLHHLFLQDWNVFKRNFNPQIAPGYHDAVRGFNYLIHAVYALLVLNLRDYHSPGIKAFEKRTHVLNVLFAPYKRLCDEISTVLHHKPYVFFVLFSYCRQPRLYSGYCDCFPVAYAALVEDFAEKMIRLNLKNFNCHKAVINQYYAADIHLIYQILMEDECVLFAFLYVAGAAYGNLKDFTFLKLNFLAGSPYFGALRVYHQAYGEHCLFVQLPDALHNHLMPSLVAMGHVYPYYVHAVP